MVIQLELLITLTQGLMHQLLLNLKLVFLRVLFGSNRATGVNSYVIGARDEVMFIQVMGSKDEGASRRYLEAHLAQGESYFILMMG